MKLSLDVRVDDFNFRGGATLDVPSLQLKCFEPVNTDDDVMMCIANASLPAGGGEFRRAVKTREDAAKILADELARMIVSEMKKNDTHNGYGRDS